MYRLKLYFYLTTMRRACTCLLRNSRTNVTRTYIAQLEVLLLILSRLYTNMQSINRFLYGPTPEERVRTWQTKLRAESRQLDREMRQVGSRIISFDSNH